MFSITTATTEDVRAIQQLLRETWQDTYGEYLSQETLDEVYKNWQSIEFLSKQVVYPGVYFSLVKDGEKLLGLATAEEKDGVITLHRLYISPTAQRQGIGSILLQDVVDEFDEAKKIKIHVEVFNKKGIEFYLKQGFKEIETFTEKIGDESIEEIVMEKEL